MRTYKVDPKKKFQVVLRKPDGRNGIVAKKFFATEEAADAYVDANEGKFIVDKRNLEYFSAL